MTPSSSLASKSAPVEAASPNVPGGRGLGSSETNQSIAQRAIGLSDLTKAKLLIASLESLDEIRDLGLKASAAADYFRRAKASQELVREAVAVQVWSERRAGELVDRNELAARPGRGAYLRELGTTPHVVRRWTTFADSPEDLVAKAISAVEDSSVTAIYRRLIVTPVERLESGLCRNGDGRFIIRYRHQGRAHREVIDGDVAKARHALLVRRGEAVAPKRRRQRPRSQQTVMAEETHSLLRFTLQGGQQLLDFELPSAIRADVNAAMTALHRAEDLLTRVMRDLALGSAA